MMRQADRTSRMVGDLFGGLAAMLVALPSAIAFGLASFAALGPAFAGPAVLSGIVGAVLIGMLAPLLGGTPRLVSAPCAPAAAVLAVFVFELTRRPGMPLEAVPALVALATLGAGLLQAALGALGGGRFIKYIPYPVVAGYLSGVGVLIVIGQLPKLLGLPAGMGLGEGLFDPAHWQWAGLVSGGATILMMLFARRLTSRVPAAVLALATGIIAYYLAALGEPALAAVRDNPLLIGPLAAAPQDLARLVGGIWSAFAGLSFSDLATVLVPAGTLAVLLSVDTLKTCVVLDAMVRGRHDSNRELVGQGIANCAAAACGGLAGAGTMGATLVNLASGGVTRRSGFLVGLFSLAVLFLLGPLVAGVPLGALAGLLVVIGIRMVDWKGFRLLKRRGAALDFLVVLAVVAAAVALNLLAAAGVGVAMAILLFLRDQMRGSVISRRTSGAERFSKRRRLPAERAVLEEHGGETLILELRGALFFGTADQLLSELAPLLPRIRRLVLEMSRVQSIDFTGANLLRQLAGRLADGGGVLAFTALSGGPRGLSGYLESTGLLEGLGNLRVFPDLEDALEWVEATVLSEAGLGGEAAGPLAAAEFEIFAGFEAAAFAALEGCLVERQLADGEAVFRRGEAGESLYLIRSGAVKIVLPLSGGLSYHLATFSRGDFFGDMAFLDKEIRSADALAAGEVLLYELSRSGFDAACGRDCAIAARLFERLSLALSLRLRQNNAGLVALRED